MLIKRVRKVDLAVIVLFAMLLIFTLIFGPKAHASGAPKEVPEVVVEEVEGGDGDPVVVETKGGKIIIKISIINKNSATGGEAKSSSEGKCELQSCLGKVVQVSVPGPERVVGKIVYVPGPERIVEVPVYTPYTTVSPGAFGGVSVQIVPPMISGGYGYYGGAASYYGGGGGFSSYYGSGWGGGGSNFYVDNSGRVQNFDRGGYRDYYGGRVGYYQGGRQGYGGGGYQFQGHRGYQGQKPPQDHWRHSSKLQPQPRSHPSPTAPGGYGRGGYNGGGGIRGRHNYGGGMSRGGGMSHRGGSRNGSGDHSGGGRHR